MRRLWRIAKRIWQVVKEMAWIVGFLVLVLPALERHPPFAQDAHSIRASVRPNDSVKVIPELPWVSEYQPPLQYEEWWGQIASCEHLAWSLQMTRQVRWIQINSKTFRLGIKSEWAFGFADEPHLTIYMAQSSVMEEEVVKHEMVHMLNYWNGVDEGEDYHPPDNFKEVCGLHVHHK